MRSAVWLAVLLVPALAAFAQESRSPGPERTGSVARGKYIVENVAMCSQCHTPRDGVGRLLHGQYLEGAPVPVKAPPYPGVTWAARAPAIAGLPGYTTEQGIRLLTEGITAEGRYPSAPMPSFRFTRVDAEAVVAYLKSLPD